MAIQKYFVEVTDTGVQCWFMSKSCKILHRLDGPALIDSDGYNAWYVGGQLHRTDGPAIVTSLGDQRWYHHGKLHREDGPAVIYPDGGQAWYLDDLLHRTGGPALEWADGRMMWYLNGLRVTQARHSSETAPAQELTVAQIEALLGKKIKIIK